MHTKTIKKIFFFSIILIALFYPKTSFASSNTYVYFSPNKTSLNLGEEVTIYVNAKNVSNLYGASIDLKYNTSQLQILEITKGNVFSGYNTYEKNFSNANGISSYISTIIENCYGVDTSSTALFIIKAKVLSIGDINISINSKDNSNDATIKLSDSNAAPISFGCEPLTLKVNAPNPLTVGKYEDDHPNITYIGNWLSNNLSYYSGENLKYTFNVGDSANFSFIGTGFKWTTSTSRFRGIANVTVDDKVYTVDTYSSSDQFKKVAFEISDLEPKVHNVKIQLSQDKNVNALERSLAIDSIDILFNSTPLNSGMYEENDKNILYSKGWTEYKYSGYSGGTTMYTTTPGSSCEFNFNGTGIKLFGSTSRYRGIAKVTLDDQAFFVDSFSYTDNLKSKLFEVNGLENKNHTIKIELLNRKIYESTGVTFALDVIEILNTPINVLKPGKYEDSNSNLNFNGGWKQFNYDAYSNKDVKLSSNVGDYVKFSFEGTGFKWISSLSRFRGIAKIQVDNKEYTADAYSSSDQFNKTVFEINNLSYGNHTAIIKVTDNKNPQSKDISQALDYIEVLNSNDSILTKGVYEEDNSKLIYTGNWMDVNLDYYSNGKTKYTTTPGSSLNFKFKGTGIKLLTSTSRFRGIANIYIDGKVYTADLYSKTDQFKNNVFEIDGLNNANHDVKIELSKDKNQYSSGNTMAIDIVEILESNLTVLNPGKYEDTNASIKYFGNWNTVQLPQYSDGVLTYSYSSGSYATFAFNGSGFDLISSTSVYRGICNIYIDGKLYNADLYSAKDEFQKTVFSIGNLPTGQHYVKIEVTNNKNSSSQGNMIAIDAINIKK